MNRKAEKTFKTIKAYSQAKANCKKLIRTKDSDNIKLACIMSLRFGFFPNFNKFAKKYLKIGMNAKYIYGDYRDFEDKIKLEVKNTALIHEIGLSVYALTEGGGVYRWSKKKKLMSNQRYIELERLAIQEEIHQKITSIQDQGDCEDQKCPYFDDYGIEDYSFKVDWDYLWKNHKKIYGAIIERISKDKSLKNQEIPF